MIHCPKCKAVNEPQRDTCDKCKTDLLPGVKAGFFTVETPLHERYANRARRHIVLDVGQALADFTRALDLVAKTERTPLLKERVALYRELEMREELKLDWEEILTRVPKTKRTALLVERAGIYAQLEMNLELSQDLEAILSHYLTNFESASGLEKENLAIKIPKVFTDLEAVYRKLGREKEAVRTHLEWTYFAEEYRHDLFTGKALPEIMALGVSLFGYNSEAASIGWEHYQVEELAKEFQNERLKMVSAGQVQAIGCCPKCEQAVGLFYGFQCPICLGMVTPEGRFVMPEEVAAAVQVLRWQKHLPQYSSQPEVREQPTPAAMNLQKGMMDSIAQYDRMIVDPHIHFQSDIPPKMLTNALNSYAMEALPEQVLVLLDDTAFGSAKKGMLLTGTHLYAQLEGNEPDNISLSSIETVSYVKKGAGLMDSAGLFVNGMPFQEGHNIYISITAIQEFVRMLNQIVALWHPQANAGKIINSLQLMGVGRSIFPQESAKMGIPEIVARYSPMVMDERFYFYPNIPQKKLLNALDAYARDVRPEDVLVMVDDEISGNAKDGVILTGTNIHAHGSFQKPSCTQLSSITDVNFFKGKPTKLFINGELILTSSNPEKLAWYLFMLMLKEIVTTFHPGANTAAPTEPLQPEEVALPPLSEGTTKGRVSGIMRRYHPLLIDPCFFFHPGIPPKKLQNALGAYAGEVNPEDVLVLVADSGNAKDGAILTETQLLTKGERGKQVGIKLSSHEDVSFTKGGSGTPAELLFKGEPFLKLSHPEKQARHMFALMLKEIVGMQEPEGKPVAPIEVAPPDIKDGPMISPNVSDQGFGGIVSRHKPASKEYAIFFQPDIPEKKLVNAINSYAKGVLPREVWVLVDESIFGNAKDGIILTETQLIARSFKQEPIIIPLSDIKEVAYLEGSQKPPIPPKLVINGSPFISLINLTKPGALLLVGLLREIIQAPQDR